MLTERHMNDSKELEKIKRGNLTDRCNLPFSKPDQQENKGLEMNNSLSISADLLKENIN